MDEQTAVELRALRARAYGPAADLQGDADGMRRLEELETLALRASSTARASSTVRASPGGRGDVLKPHAGESEAAVFPPRPGRTDTDADGEVVLDSLLELLREERGTSPLDPVSPRRWWTRRRIAALGAVALVAVLVLTATVSAAFTYRLQSGPHEVAVLAIDPGTEMPPVFGGTNPEGTVFAEFYGMLPVVTEAVTGQAQNEECLLILDASHIQHDGRGYQGTWFDGCAAGAFAATAEFIVVRGMPDELRERFPEGTSLQFLLRDSQVVVFSFPPEPDPAPSEVEAVRGIRE